MILSEDIYNDIVNRFQNQKGSYRELKNAMMEEYRIPNAVLSSLLSNEYRRRIKKNFYRMNNQGNKLFQRYMNSRSSEKNSSSIIKLAEEIKMSYTLLGRMIAEKFLQQDDEGATNSSKLARLKYYMKDSTLIEDPDLAYEIFLCVLYDEQFGHLTEIISLSLGKEYEHHLQKIIREKNLTFQCEDDLRECGYDKTPDIKLNVPFAVDGFIVNWIESKALFASPKIHKGYVEEQYSSYWNRFGTGLVIYWKGVVDTVIDPKEKRFIVRCEFPENITLLNPFYIASIPKGLKYEGKVLVKEVPDDG
ncbi:UNVERIFIED_CONTAM: hypothetical protein PYX00_006966 [Menopon gallinae]|uniref:CDAN1-interacting nuclease 1 n=1 Tax=Menopon gallinae TaxID=328185 RepID=A0AAW2HHC9_9NEOP